MQCTLNSIKNHAASHTKRRYIGPEREIYQRRGGEGGPETACLISCWWWPTKEF